MSTKKHLYPYWTLLVILASGVFVPWAVNAQIEAQPPLPTIFQHMLDRQISNLTIATDFTTLITERKLPHSLDATITLETDRGETEKMDIKVELRGRNRRKICQMPPLRLDFSKKDLAERGFSEEGDKLKLVTHCMDEYDEEFLLREFWAYRLYNALTPVSFRVHLVKVRYVDTANPGAPPDEKLAFIIETEEELAARFNCQPKDLFGMMPGQVDQKTYRNSVLFQYMIGNDDWGMTNPRNVYFMLPPNSNVPLLVPYDFDFAGLVDAPYAIANPNYDGEDVLDRVVIHPFISKEDLHQAIQDFLTTKNTMLKCYETCAWMSEASKKKMDKYLDDFFREIQKTKKMERIFLAKK